MREYLTDALVLDSVDQGELDRMVYLYAPNFGKIAAKAKSSRKITSKLAGHLEPLSLSKVRLVEKNGIQITDAILIRKMDVSPQSLELARFLKEMTFEFQTDRRLWRLAKKSFEDLANDPKSFSYKPILDCLGFSPDFAACQICGSRKIKAFSITEHVFLCEKCATLRLKTKSGSLEFVLL